MQIAQTAKLVGAGAVTLLIMAVVLSQLVAVVDVAGTANLTAAATTTEGTAQLDTDVGVQEHLGATLSLNDQASLSGASDSEIVVEGDYQMDTTLSEWTVSVFTSTSATGQTATILSLQDLQIVYNGTASEYRAYYYDATNRTMERVAVAASSPSTPTGLVVHRDGDTVRLAANETAVATEAIDGVGVDASAPATNYEGNVEELRAYDRVLTTSQRGSLIDQPTQAVSGSEPALRLPFDVRSRQTDTVRTFFGADRAEIRNAQLVDGYGAPEIQRGTDYEWRGTELVVTSSTIANSGEIVYHEFSGGAFIGVLDTAENVGASALALLVVGLLVVAATRLLSVFDGGGM